MVFKFLKRLTFTFISNFLFQSTKLSRCSGSFTTNSPVKSRFKTKKGKKVGLETASIPAILSAYTAYLVQFLVGTIREALYGTGPLTSRQEEFGEKGREGYPPLFSAFENFYIRNVFQRAKDIFFRPITSVPGAKVKVIPHKSDDFNWTCTMDLENEQEHINLASYNYLGFAENSGDVSESVIETTSISGLTPCSTRQELGTNTEHASR